MTYKTDDVDCENNDNDDVDCENNDNDDVDD